MICLDSAGLLRIVAETRPVRATHLILRHLGLPEAEELVEGCAAACGAQLHTLALSLAYREPSKGLAALLKLLKAGKLQGLRKLLLECIPDHTSEAELWESSLRAILQAGCSVHMLTEGWSGRDIAAFQELRSSMPDPGMLQIGDRADAHGAGT